MQYQNDDGQCEYFRKDNDALKTKRHTTITESYHHRIVNRKPKRNAAMTGKLKRKYPQKM